MIALRVELPTLRAVVVTADNRVYKIYIGVRWAATFFKLGDRYGLDPMDDQQPFYDSLEVAAKEALIGKGYLHADQ